MWVRLTTSEDLTHLTTGKLGCSLVLFENYIHIITNMNVDSASTIHGTIGFNPGSCDIDDSHNSEEKYTEHADEYRLP